MCNRRMGRASRGVNPRKLNTRPLKKRFLIVCEGKTEEKYFLGFNVPGQVKGLGDNTLSLVERAAALKEEDDFDQVWCIFDRDEFPDDRFNRALDLARRHGISVAYSNEAFELWYLLHFAYHDTGMGRSHYETKLSKCLGSRYDKTRDDMFKLLEMKQRDAIRNAERLMAQYPHPNPEADNPSTTVHLLVAELNRYRRP